MIWSVDFASDSIAVQKYGTEVLYLYYTFLSIPSRIIGHRALPMYRPQGLRYMWS